MCRRGIWFGVILVLAVRVAAGQGHREELRSLQPRINEAIDRGAQWLIDRQLVDGSWGFMSPSYRSGQTALATYTLLKSGISRHHPAVRKGLACIRAREADRTYSLALQLMALDAAGFESDEKLIAKRRDLLSGWQARSGAYGYPGLPDEMQGGGPGGAAAPPTWEDLSNMQYAALGLRGAGGANRKTDRRVLKRLLQRALSYQEEEVKAKLPAPVVEGKGRRYGNLEGSGYCAGFGYLPAGSPFGGPPGMGAPGATGSMTTAGLGVLLIVAELYGGKIPRQTARLIEKRVERGLNWLRRNWTVAANPGVGAPAATQWHYYYLYGLERVGSLTGQEILCGRPWYLEGARLLVDQQGTDGSWPSGGAAVEPDTCFALLFLKRATAVGGETGQPARVRDLWRTLSGDLRITAQGDPEVAFWVDGFADEVERRWGGRRRLLAAITRVEYRIGDTDPLVIAGKDLGRREGPLFPARRTLAKGTHELVVRVTLRPAPKEAKAGGDALVVLASDPLSITIDRDSSRRIDAVVRAVEGNVLAPGASRVRASSSASAATAAEKVVDGLEVTSWTSRGDDAEPWIEIKPRKARRAQRLLLTQTQPRSASELALAAGAGPPGFGPPGRAAPSSRRPDRTFATEVEIFVNGSKRALMRAPLEAKGAATEIVLPRPIAVKLLRLRIRGRSEAGRGVGFSEIYLYP